MSVNLLLINPWIYDFAAYDLWSKPLGLLYLASLLRNNNFRVSYLDCLDKYAFKPEPIVKKYGQGNFYREVVEKPSVLRAIPRKFARYGISEELFYQKLREIPPPEAILITSFMTYWYLGPQKVVKILRDVYPRIPIILGGIYATLLPEHAKAHVKPDFVITGAAEIKILRLLSDLFHLPYHEMKIPENIDDYPYPAYDLINHPDYLIILTSRGCPYNCSFCAQKKLYRKFIQRDPHRVIEEIIYHYKKFKLQDFVFYDDALFINRDGHIKIILKKIIDSKLPIRFHTPNGLFPDFIDQELANLMYQANFKTIRLSFETVNESKYKDLSNKVTLKGMMHAVKYLTNAGYKSNELDAYIIMGLPDQDLEEILASMFFINKLGVKIKLASFSPIAGTKYYQQSIESGLIPANIDPLLTNKSIFPLQNSQLAYDSYRKVRHLSQILNEAAQSDFKSFSDVKISPSLLSVLRRFN
jgi:radical SAM superfamily enzyme YgiQ (UPF0313 family)